MLVRWRSYSYIVVFNSCVPYFLINPILSFAEKKILKKEVRTRDPPSSIRPRLDYEEELGEYRSHLEMFRINICHAINPAVCRPLFQRFDTNEFKSMHALDLLDILHSCVQINISFLMN